MLHGYSVVDEFVLLAENLHDLVDLVGETRFGLLKLRRIVMFEIFLVLVFASREGILRVEMDVELVQLCSEQLALRLL